MYALTPNNIYLRYMAARDEAKRRREAGDRGAKFTYREMADLFLVTEQACYTWTLDPEHKGSRCPKGPRATKVKQWINDGVLDAYLARAKDTNSGQS